MKEIKAWFTNVKTKSHEPPHHPLPLCELMSFTETCPHDSPVCVSKIQQAQRFCTAFF